MGRHLSPRYGQVILVSGYPVLTAVNWSQHWCAICVQYQSSCAPRLARKCEIEHWFSCGADGRAGCGRCTVTWLPNFLGWVDLLTHGAPRARFARQSSAITVISAFRFANSLSIYPQHFACQRQIIINCTQNNVIGHTNTSVLMNYFILDPSCFVMTTKQREKTLQENSTKES